jgi:hypothetical protein
MMGLDPWGLRRIEKLLLSLEGVGSLKIVPDGQGGIEEIHVLSSSSLGPKQIVRNIESALLADFGLQIDHRKISIARVRSPEIAPAAPAEVPDTAVAVTPAPVLASDRRLVLGNVHIERAAGQKVTCRVDLAREDSVFTGEAEGPDFERARMEVAATAALERIGRCLRAELRPGRRQRFRATRHRVPRGRRPCPGFGRGGSRARLSQGDQSVDRRPLITSSSCA